MAAGWVGVGERDSATDLEVGEYTCEEGSKDANSGGRHMRKGGLSRIWSGFLRSDGSISGEETPSFTNNVNDEADISLDRNDFPGEKKAVDREKIDSSETKPVREKPKKAGGKKPPKPPRPPKAVVLNPSDQKLVREISELAMLKRARIERIKTLKKMRAAKAASSSGNMYAMVITILFCIVMILQGLFSRGSSSTVNLQLSPVPVPAGTARGGFITVQYNRNSGVGTPGFESVSPNEVEQSSGSDTYKKERVVG
ncbi:uncharacterized protein LOC18431446 [Amborella trichopoda]|uniref:uncharacterized protein LOC18431446 n=1 Tax=Amborella trichopoda TaxID=13333 RepID=UPI0005D455BC|nr:uncharacterized protein LOC18431446 [Amborella trichopoda]XP_020521020.1 uncharacterized protein LOC18431446 [Amborella trichopoda]|eukprot:XP_006841634.2 uncharacterized protein LOC18431446 [Amborella trichopoda]